MTSKLTITRERLQEIAEDGFLKHGESKKMARMLLAAQAHITELEAAPPAPVGPGEEPMPVMPDFPGKAMTQRECWQAGKKVGLAEGRYCAAIPDGLNIRAVAALREAVRNQWLKSDELADKIYWKSMHDIANEIVVAMLAAAPQEVKS